MLAHSRDFSLAMINLLSPSFRLHGEQKNACALVCVLSLGVFVLTFRRLEFDVMLDID